MKRVSVAVIGLGVVGSAITHELSRRQRGVVGFERYWSVHDQGSSYGHTRLFRRTHFEHPDYVPLAEASFAGFRELERRSERRLFAETGALVIGPEGRGMVAGTLAAGAAHGIRQRKLDGGDLRRALPWIVAGANDVGVLEPGAGVLFAQECVGAFQQSAIRQGAELRFGADVEIVDPGASDEIELLVNGERIVAERVVVAAGPWCGGLLPADSVPKLEVERVTSYWFEPRGTAPGFDPVGFPVVLWDHSQRPFITFPMVAGPGVKIGFHHNQQAVNPDELVRTVSDDEILEARAQVERAMPVVAGPLRRASTCMYTNTRDGHFAVGFVGAHERIVLASACSGHGFKFAPVVGEIVADLMQRGTTNHPMELFRLDRASLHPRSGIFGVGTSPVPNRGRAAQS